MAHHKSAKKRIRSNGAKQVRNTSYYSSVKSAVKRFKIAVGAVEGHAAPASTPESLQALLSNAQSLLDRAAKRGIIHKNNASRRVTRLAALLAKSQVAKSQVAKSQAPSTNS